MLILTTVVEIPSKICSFFVGKSFLLLNVQLSKRFEITTTVASLNNKIFENLIFYFVSNSWMYSTKMQHLYSYILLFGKGNINMYTRLWIPMTVYLSQRIKNVNETKK
jgi:hypothetical protein